WTGDPLGKQAAATGRFKSRGRTSKVEGRRCHVEAKWRENCWKARLDPLALDLRIAAEQDKGLSGLRFFLHCKGLLSGLRAFFFDPVALAAEGDVGVECLLRDKLTHVLAQDADAIFGIFEVVPIDAREFRHDGLFDLAEFTIECCNTLFVIGENAAEARLFFRSSNRAQRSGGDRFVAANA